MNPDQRPTVEQILLALQNMGISNWKSDSYSYMLPPESDEEREIRNQFWWIDGR
jgi:hypothetical protein